MNRYLKQCPVCGGELRVVRLHCPECDTGIEGNFQQPANPLAQLSAEQMQFLMNFIRCEGRFNRLEEEMRLSYPTLRNRFNDILRSLGFEAAREEVPPRINADDRRRILEELEQGRISYADAQRRLRGKKESETEA